MHVAALLATVAGLFTLAAWTTGAFVLGAWRLAWGRPEWRARLGHAAPLALIAPVAAAAGLAAATLAAGAHGCHCELTSASALHLCLSHPERGAALPVAALSILPAIRLSKHLAGILRRLRANRAASAHGPVALVTAPLGTAFVLPLPRPRIVVDADWWGGLSPRDRRIVLAHERAHVRRGDPLLLELLGAAAALLPARLAEPPLHAWRARAEREADAAAARAVRDPLAVADLLVRLHRRGTPHAAVMSMSGGSPLADRVHALVSHRPASAPRGDLGPGSLLLVAATVAAPLLASHRVHALTERLLDLLR